jgi:hypothetical protein
MRSDGGVGIFRHHLWGFADASPNGAYSQWRRLTSNANILIRPFPSIKTHTQILYISTKESFYEARHKGPCGGNRAATSVSSS